jgi:hypothetical protein
MVRRVTEAPWRMVRRPSCCSCAALSWFCGLVSSQYLSSMRWMSRWRLVLTGEGGSADGWRCCRGAPGRLPHLPPATPNNPPPSGVGS